MSEKNKVITEKILEVHTRLYKSTTRQITTDDISYITGLPNEYINGKIENCVEVLKDESDSYDKYITKSEDNYIILPSGSFMTYMAATQMDDGTEEFKIFMKVLLILLQTQILVDEYIINKLHKEDIYNF